MSHQITTEMSESLDKTDLSAGFSSKEIADMETPAEMNMLESMISLMMRTQVKYLPIVTETLPSDKSFVNVNLKVC